MTSSWPALFGGAVIGAVAVFLLPRNALPAVALWVLVLFPVGFMPFPALVGRYITPAVIIIAIWMIRLALAQRMTMLLRMPIRGWLITAPLLVLLFASTVFSESIDRTLAWMAAFIVCVVAPALLGQIAVDDVWPTVRWALAGIGLFLGVLAAADFLFQFNPWTLLYKPVPTVSLYDQAHTESVFRARTSLGHPLGTAMVASIALAACLFPSSKTRQWPYWICAAGALVALILSVSRASVIAVGVSAIIGMLSAPPRTGQSVTRVRGWRGRPIAVLIAAAFFAAVALSPLLSRRNMSEEGRSSANLRSQLLDTATTLIGEHPMLGFGPGVSRVAYAYYHISLENSALQLMVSVGLPAFFFILAGFAVLVAVAMRRSRAGVAAGIVAFWISAAGSNAIDSDPSTLALIAPLIVCAVMPDPGRSERIENNGPETPRQTMTRHRGMRGRRAHPRRAG